MSDADLPKTPEPEVEDDVLTVRANLARARLLRSVDALDRKRHDVADAVDVGLQMQKHAQPVMIGGAVLVLSLGGLVAYAVHRIATRAERRRRERISLLKRMWFHPERTAKPQSRSFFAQLARNVLLGIATTALMIPAKHFLTQAADAAMKKREGV